MNLSIIIIVQEEQKNSSSVKRAVQSAQFADEILVVPQKFPVINFSACRNNAMQKAKGEWVMFLDSDEIISEGLSSEIKSQISRLQAPRAPAIGGQANLKSSGKAGSRSAGQNHNSKLNTHKINAFCMKRRDKFLGKWLQHGETAHVKLLRLAKRGAGKWVRPVHEVWKVEGVTGELKEPLLHYSHQTADEMLEKLDWYSNLESKYRKSLAQKMHYNRSGRNDYNTFLIISLMLFPIGKFIQNYFFRLGFLDGMPGFIHAAMMSFHSFLVRAKQMEISTNKYE